MSAPAPTRWRKSTHSDASNVCVEIAHMGSSVVLRDSKNPTGPALIVPFAFFVNLLRAV
ncbi:MAG TPA: DUF397 domain-containing protein [Actinophytocola sp.]|jgi:hypothetical protein|uniref:DUF397 domain-containing protein n=1 Tax=Actinophytocola sp. TaxID=1872138 RepID=UPI002E0BA474|nr:DUF397 domain-containing protein [Actinophytocola sp.]